jgi:hypothetical protein
VQLYLSGQLLQVCSKIFDEAITVLYSQNAFVAVDPWSLDEGFLCRISPRNQSLLRSLKVHVDGDGICNFRNAIYQLEHTFQKHLALRFIEQFTITLLTTPPSSSCLEPYSQLDMDLQETIDAYKSTEALLSFVNVGRRKTHVIKASATENDGMVWKTTIGLARCAAQVREQHRLQIIARR